MDYWARLDELVASHEVIIDRPAGTGHPRYPGIVYPLDYGYLAGTSGGDGAEADVWKGSLTPARVVAVVCTVDTLKHDVETKILIGCTDDEMDAVRRFHNHPAMMSGLLVTREGRDR